MTNQTAISVLRAYRSAISQERGTHRATEHSYRPAFKALVEALGGNGIIAINDPTHVDVGAPDFIVQRHSVPIAHIECKDIGDNLNSTEESEQLQRYRNGLPNLILTDYLEFRWYVDGQLKCQWRRNSGPCGRQKSGPPGVIGQHKAIVLIVKIVRRLLRSGPSAVRSWPCCSRR